MTCLLNPPDPAVVQAMRRIAFRNALLTAPAPNAVLASISPIPMGQKMWFAKMCGDLCDAMDRLPSVQSGEKH